MLCKGRQKYSCQENNKFILKGLIPLIFLSNRTSVFDGHTTLPDTFPFFSQLTIIFKIAMLCCLYILEISYSSEELSAVPPCCAGGEGWMLPVGETIVSDVSISTSDCPVKFFCIARDEKDSSRRCVELEKLPLILVISNLLTIGFSFSRDPWRLLFH